MRWFKLTQISKVYQYFQIVAFGSRIFKSPISRSCWTGSAGLRSSLPMVAPISNTCKCGYQQGKWFRVPFSFPRKGDGGGILEMVVNNFKSWGRKILSRRFVKPQTGSVILNSHGRTILVKRAFSYRTEVSLLEHSSLILI